MRKEAYHTQHRLVPFSQYSAFAFPIRFWIESVNRCGCCVGACRLILALFYIAFCILLSFFTNRLARVASRRVQTSVVRGFSAGKESKPTIPFGIGKFLGEESDFKIPTDKEQKSKPEPIPDFVPEDIRKDMEALGLEGMKDLDELELKNTDGYNDLGLVPPEGTGTFASPILIPSRRSSRVVGYEDPTSHAMFWFTIHHDDSTYYIKDLGLFFKMLHIPDESYGQGHH